MSQHPFSVYDTVHVRGKTRRCGRRGEKHCNSITLMVHVAVKDRILARLVIFATIAITEDIYQHSLCNLTNIKIECLLSSLSEFRRPHPPLVCMWDSRHWQTQTVTNSGRNSTSGIQRHLSLSPDKRVPLYIGLLHTPHTYTYTLIPPSWVCVCCCPHRHRVQESLWRGRPSCEGSLNWPSFCRAVPTATCSHLSQSCRGSPFLK